MLLKFFFLLTVGTISVLATDLGNFDDAKAIQIFFKTQDPTSIELQAAIFRQRILDILEVGKQKALSKVHKKWEIAAVEEKWAKVTELKVNVQKDVRQVVNSLRKSAMAKAPRAWSQAIQMSITYFEKFKKIVATGDANAVERVVIHGKRNLRQMENFVKRAIAENSCYV